MAGSDRDGDAPTLPAPATPQAATPQELANAATVGAAAPHAATTPSAPVRGRAESVGPGASVGRYEILGRLGAGGMGIVYRARDPRLDREVALKLVTPGDADITVAQARLEREAQAMAKLSHANVAAVHDIGAWHGQIYIAMELCPGGSLGAWLRGGRQPWRDVLVRFLAAGRGLAAAHRLGLVHRDFKPDNILIGRDDVVKVSDFGLVRSAERAEIVATTAVTAAGDVSVAGALVGTPAYMAPEQITGKPAEAASDQFAFAVSLWEGLTGQRPFQPRPGSADPLGSLLDTITSGHRPPPPTTTGAPRRVWQALERALAADPAARWPTMEALLAEIEATIAPPQRRRWLIPLAAAAIIAVGIVVAVVLAPADPAANQRRWATQLVALAKAAIADHRGADAVVALDLAWMLSHDPEVLRLTGDAERLRTRCAPMLRAYDAYVMVATNVPASVRQDILMYHKQCELFRAQAKQDVEEVGNPEELLDLARHLQQRGEFEAAAIAFARLYEMTGDPGMISSMGDNWILGGECKGAMQAYDEFERKAPPEMLDAMRHWIAGQRDVCKTGQVVWPK